MIKFMHEYVDSLYKKDLSDEDREDLTRKITVQLGSEVQFHELLDAFAGFCRMVGYCQETIESHIIMDPDDYYDKVRKEVEEAIQEEKDQEYKYLQQHPENSVSSPCIQYNYGDRKDNTYTVPFNANSFSEIKVTRCVGDKELLLWPTIGYLPKDGFDKIQLNQPLEEGESLWIRYVRKTRKEFESLNDEELNDLDDPTRIQRI